jgi:AraC-like DNA-binding protein
MCLSHFISLFIYNQKHFAVTATDKVDSIDSAILYMQEHINENITFSQLSSRYNYSPSRFSSLFRQRTGYAPIDYFIQMKRQKASQQLDFTDKSVKDIALSMGFEDPYYFPSGLPR